MNNIKREPCDRFSDKVWLFIEKSLSLAVKNNSSKNIKIPERRSLLDIIGIYRLTFGGAIVVGAIIFLLITFLNNPKIPAINKEISSHLLSWDNENVSEQLSKIEDQIISLKTDDWD
ncbi:MAG: hypothetical protein P8Y79_00710, partial [Ignavibacteriaceae bacterium]